MFLKSPYIDQAMSQVCAFPSPFCGNDECCGDLTTTNLLMPTASRGILTLARYGPTSASGQSSSQMSTYLKVRYAEAKHA